MDQITSCHTKSITSIMSSGVKLCIRACMSSSVCEGCLVAAAVWVRFAVEKKKKPLQTEPLALHRKGGVLNYNRF